MPNGSELTDDEYQKLQRAFAPAEQECEAFAQSTHAEYSQHFHGTPKRDFTYVGDDAITRLVTISPGLYDRGRVDKAGYPTFVKRDSPIFLFGVAAWKDGNLGRKSWHREFDIRSELPEPHELKVMLHQMLDLVNSIRDNDLT